MKKPNTVEMCCVCVGVVTLCKQISSLTQIQMMHHTIVVSLKKPDNQQLVLTSILFLFHLLQNSELEILFMIVFIVKS